MKRQILLFIIAPIISFAWHSAHPAFAETKSFVKEYTYQAGESESKLSCRAIALEQVKRLLLEELGTYLVSQTEVRNFQLTKDQIVTFTSGIVMSVIINEKWDGQVYFLKARITADPDDVAKSIDALRKDREKTDELVDLQARSSAALSEIARLKAELAASKNDTALKDNYSKSVNKLLANELLEKGIYLQQQNKHQEAVGVFTKSIDFYPDYARAYSFRGWSNYQLKQYAEANSDYDAAIRINPAYLYPYVNKGWIALDQGRPEDGLALFELALAADPKFARGYNARGHYYSLKGLLDQAKADFDRAIELDPQFFATYLNRGLYFFKIKQYQKSLTDYNKGLELNPYFAKGYFGRGNTYKKLNEKSRAEEDYKMAAKLGYKKAR